MKQASIQDGMQQVPDGRPFRRNLSEEAAEDQVVDAGPALLPHPERDLRQGQLDLPQPYARAGLKLTAAGSRPLQQALYQSVEHLALTLGQGLALAPGEDPFRQQAQDQRVAQQLPQPGALPEAIQHPLGPLGSQLGYELAGDLGVVPLPQAQDQRVAQQLPQPGALPEAIQHPLGPLGSQLGYELAGDLGVVPLPHAHRLGPSEPGLEQREVL